MASLNLPLELTWEHAFTRFQCVTDAVIHKLQTDFFAGRDLGRSIPDLHGDIASVMVAESLEADIIWNQDPNTLLGGAIKERRNSDFMRAALAEICFQVFDSARRANDTKSAQTWWAVAMANLQELTSTPTASPLLDYEEIYFELSQKSRGFADKEAVNWLKRSLAHRLKYDEGRNTVQTLRDLADLHFKAGEPDEGMKIVTALLHHDPADIWTYNSAAISFDEFGLPELGILAAQRGLQLLDVQGDQHDLRGQLNDCLKQLQRNMQRSSKANVAPHVLSEFRRALNLDFESGQPVPIPLLSNELVPDLDKVPVKRALTSREFPLPRPADVLPLLQNTWANKIKKKTRRRHKKR